jgi:hypothetical protein
MKSNIPLKIKKVFFSFGYQQERKYPIFYKKKINLLTFFSVFLDDKVYINNYTYNPLAASLIVNYDYCGNTNDAFFHFTHPVEVYL